MSEELRKKSDAIRKECGIDGDPMRYPNTGKSPASRAMINERNWRKAERDAAEGKVINLTDLMISSEKVIMDQWNDDKS